MTMETSLFNELAKTQAKPEAQTHSAPHNSIENWLKAILLIGLSRRHKLRLLIDAQHGLLGKLDQRDELIALTQAQTQAFIPPQQWTTQYFQQLDRRCQQCLELMHKHNIGLIPFHDQLYPALLREIADPPLALFYQGGKTQLNQAQIAMVGSRNPTPGGIKTAQQFAQHLSQLGFVVTSGLALGIDTSAHQGALSVNAATIAVVATGLDQVYPRRNAKLATHILQRGVLVSEQPPLTPPRRELFPQRNRIISGLALGCLVVEAGARSGSLITARLAIEQGREVYAIPGSIHSAVSKGCHYLLRQGAKLVEQTSDITEELIIQPALLANDKAATPSSATEQGATAGCLAENTMLDVEQQRVLAAVDFAATSIDEIMLASGLSAEQVSSILLQLELRGMISTVAGGCYQRLNSNLKSDQA